MHPFGRVRLKVGELFVGEDGQGAQRDAPGHAHRLPPSSFQQDAHDMVLHKTKQHERFF